MVRQGGTTKYLIYAVGEVLLVMVGILLALQVNNWNVKRLERLEEKEILQSVKNDLENTISEFDYLNEIRDKVLHGTRGIFNVAQTMEVESQNLDSLIGLTFYRPTFNNTLGSIDLLFSSGKINLINNDSIREQLIAWPGFIDDMVEEEVYASNLFQNLYYPTVAKFAVIQDLLEYAFSTSFFGTQINTEDYINTLGVSDYKGLLKNKEFLNHLRMRASHMQITKGETQELIHQAQGLIRMIDVIIQD